MRLIDADKIDFNEVFVGASKFAEDTRQAGKMLIDAQPTAYDVDKVVEQLGKKQNNKGFGGTIQEIFYDSGLEDAIEIVKGGGIDGNTNT
jgi:hypothetical protein|nr:MAG TPA: hypothetical protein [Caudoviricetes sp.]